jgi:hypothetical protein
MFYIQEPSIVGNNDLTKWQDAHPWFELKEVYTRTTQNIRVTVIPFFIGVKVHFFLLSLFSLLNNTNSFIFINRKKMQLNFHIG